ncbi:hypothetical protein HPP92_014520 [Vanilla planifolia]|nr:hypothetical protein HPP92_014520 [Vanilla planifolia]
MMDQHPWRPQRGLPERSVSILRAWLFEHFLHPYPNDIDKHILARQSGLSRGQVSNWFINARVRLWKPMIEEMYAKEIKDREAPQPAGDEADGCASKSNANPDSKKGDEAQRNPMVGNEGRATSNLSAPSSASTAAQILFR